MLKFMETNKKYIWWIVIAGLFGVAGLLLVPVVKGVIKVATHYPKAVMWVFIIIFGSICIYEFLVTRNLNTRIAIICMGIAITINSLKTNNKQ